MQGRIPDSPSEPLRLRDLGLGVCRLLLALLVGCGPHGLATWLWIQGSPSRAVGLGLDWDLLFCCEERLD